MTTRKLLLASLAMLTIAYLSCNLNSCSKRYEGFRHDSIEDTEKYKSIISSVDSLVYEELVKEDVFYEYLGGYRHRNINRVYDLLLSKYTLAELLGDSTITDTTSYIEIAKKRRRKGNYNCHNVWQTRKRILEEKYNIDWKTPAEMNPEVRFD